MLQLLCWFLGFLLLEPSVEAASVGDLTWWSALGRAACAQGAAGIHGVGSVAGLSTFLNLSLSGGKKKMGTIVPLLASLLSEGLFLLVFATIFTSWVLSLGLTMEQQDPPWEPEEGGFRSTKGLFPLR